MHSKLKGNVGQFESASYLAKRGYSIFTEQGDLSKTDIIAEKDGKLYKIQCKSVYPKNKTLTLELRKTGPNYVYYYEQKDCDMFSVYDLENEKLYWISNKILLTHKRCFTFKIDIVSSFENPLE